MYADINSAVGEPQTITFTCTGVDTDGYVNAVEFHVATDKPVD